MSDPLIYLNGTYLPRSQGQVSVMDRGFLFGDGVYEVIPAFAGRLFRAQAHLDRLQASLDQVRIPNPHSTEEWLAIMQRLVDQAPGADQSIYLQVTRGVAEQRDHRFPDPMRPTRLVMSSLFQPTPRAEKVRGIAAVTLDDIRWRLCNIKAITLLPNVLLRQQAVDAGAGEAILIRDGLALEGSASNLFVVRGDRIQTPPKGPGLLPGITRDLVVELAQANDLDCVEADISQAQLDQADEIWVTSSTREILPVVSLDGHPVGTGRAGPIWGKMEDLYQQFKAALRQSAA